MKTILLTGAGGSAAANFLDALRRSGRDYRVVGADSSPVRLHLSAADARVLIPRTESGRAPYRDALLAAIERWDVDVVHPQPDPEVRLIGSLRSELPAVTFLPSQPAIELAADKMAFAETMVRAGVPVPASLPFESLADVADETTRLLKEHPKVWVRARSGAGSRAALPVRSGEQAEAWVEWWCAERGLSPADFMACEFLPGREFAFQSLWQGGGLVAGQTRERVEYLYGHLTPSGQTSTPAVARTVRNPAVDAIACSAIRALDPAPEGVYCVDIKEDADGCPKVTEINAGRFFTTSNFFAAAGLNMPDMLVRAALGERLPPVGTSPLPSDLYWIRMVDMGYALVPGDELDAWPRAHS
jgi:glutathione synthase/RimK-type ligase-like ATP-grasp enzyme